MPTTTGQVSADVVYQDNQPETSHRHVAKQRSEISLSNVFQRACHLVSAISVIPQLMPRPESPSLGRAPTPPAPADTPAVAKLRQLLGRTVKVGIQDSRIFLGTFACTDKALNIVLANTYEYRPSEAAEDGNPPGRYVGMVMIAWKYVRDVELQIEFGESEGDYT